VLGGPYTAKRLASALLMTLQRHEATFGSMGEIEVQVAPTWGGHPLDQRAPDEP
jgi:hypothetical protein